jgi:hypothetical protein
MAGSPIITRSSIDDITVENFSRYIVYDSKRGVVNQSSDLVVAINDLHYERTKCRRENLSCDAEIFEAVDGEWLRADREEAAEEYADTLAMVKAMLAGS